jgi:hypothetical protein
MPAHFIQPILSLKNIVPIATVKIGVRELSIPASELSIFVCASEKRNAGKNEPRNPESIIGLMISLGTVFRARGRRGSITSPVKRILSEAT